MDICSKKFEKGNFYSGYEKRSSSAGEINYPKSWEGMSEQQILWKLSKISRVYYDLKDSQEYVKNQGFESEHHFTEVIRKFLSAYHQKNKHRNQNFG